MKHLKNYTLIFLIIVLLFTSVACITTKKTAITVNDFCTKTSELGCEQIELEIEDETLASIIKESAYVTKETPDGVLLAEFYIANNSSSAQAIISGTKHAANDLCEDQQTSVSKSGSNFSYYKITNYNIVCILSNVDNTIVYIRADKALESEADEIIKAIGY